jgi:hypothetical protein
MLVRPTPLNPEKELLEYCLPFQKEKLIPTPSVAFLVVKTM